MLWFIYIYWLISMVIAFTAFSAGWQAGLSAIGTTLLSVIAGAGLRGSLYGPKWQKLAGLGLAVVLIGIAHWIGQGFSAHVFGYDFTGTEWGWLGFLICFLCISKRFALSGIASKFGSYPRPQITQSVRLSESKSKKNFG